MATVPVDNDKRTAVSGLVSPSSDDVFKALAESHKSEHDGGVDGGIKAPGVLSMFNAFNIFRYSKFGLNTETYYADGHFDAPMDASPSDALKFIDIPRVDDVGNSSTFKTFNSERATIENPTASAIIEWSKKLGTRESNNYRTPAPYSSSDFLWCKYYGKVPNNRLVTLRRYPIPVEDNIANVNKNQSPLVPIAQAVTWYGKDVDNDLSKILNLNWGFKWLPKIARVDPVSGNEIAVDEVLEQLGLIKNNNPLLYKAVKEQIFSGSDSVGMAELTGYDQKMQEYVKNAYGESGPYWNRILGPVNVIDTTLIRDRGFPMMDDIEVKFDYSLRSYGNINPKIAFLDLLTNFLSLTYNSAPFWGGSIRYFTKTGLKIDPLGMEEDILNVNIPGAINKGIEALSAQIKTNLEGIKSIIDSTFKEINDPNFTIDKRSELEKRGSGWDVNQNLSGAASKMLAGKLGKLMQSPLSYRSLLDGRAIGEWHLTIGNPMNPMAMIGNLVVDNVNMTVGETLGLDDFPTEFSFKVKLKHGRPRAKQDIESMFNLGNGFMSTSALAPPSSSMNSLGEYNINKSNDLGGAEVNTASGDKVSRTKVQANVRAFDANRSINDVALATNGSASDASSVMPPGTRSNVTRLYGSAYGNSGSLPNYFKNYVTKD